LPQRQGSHFSPSLQANREIIRLRLNADVLDSEALARHLASRGFGALLGEIDKAARKSGAPFLNPDVSPSLARSQWTHAFEQVARMAALGVAIEAAKSDLAGRAGMEAIERMKIERDAPRRAIWNWNGGRTAGLMGDALAVCLHRNSPEGRDARVAASGSEI
jgi:hypothetical protein